MVDTSKRSDTAAGAPAAPTRAAADLEACFRTMTLEDRPSSSQPRPQPLQVPVPPAARADVMQQQFEMVRQHWLPQQPHLQQKQPPSYTVGESSAAAEYASIFGSRSPSNFLASHFGECSPRSNPLTAQFPSVSAIMAPSSRPLLAQPPPVPSSITNHYQPMGGHSLVGLSNPFPSAPPAAMPPGPIHSNGRHMNPFALSQPRTAAPVSFAQHDSVDQQYASAFLMSQMNSNSNQQPWPGMMTMPAPAAVPRAPTLADVRERLLHGPMDPALAMDPETAVHVVRLLQKGGAAVRRSVLAGVVGAVHAVMDCREARNVFRELLSACFGRFDELRAVVDAVRGGKGVLADITRNDHGMSALKALIAAVGRHHQLSLPLLTWMLEERLTDNCKCGEMVNHCFARVPYDVCSMMIRFAMWNITAMLGSAPGSLYLAECFANARNEELRRLEDFLLENTSRLAMGQYSNYFVQRVIECGSVELKQRVGERVAADVANLAVDKFGSFVVEACFTKYVQALSLEPTKSVLQAFLKLPGHQLAGLVRGGYSNYVVHKLLEAAKKDFPEETTALARRIEKLPAAVHREMHAQRVMRVVKKHFPRKARY